MRPLEQMYHSMLNLTLMTMGHRALDMEVLLTAEYVAEQHRKHFHEGTCDLEYYALLSGGFITCLSLFAGRIESPLQANERNLDRVNTRKLMDLGLRRPLETLKIRENWRF